jgi:hypothetical protein
MRNVSAFRGLLLSAFAALALGAPSAASAAIDCEMTFSLSGWSAFYKTASGSGTIRCNNGQSMRVSIRAKGGGITFGKSTIENGRGEFSGVHDISELLGTYVSGEAHAGATKSAKAQVVTKGEVSLALAGKGRGWDLGVAFGKFIISRR